MKIASDLQGGAEAYQQSELPPITVPNLESVFIHGEFLTDKIASWIESGFVVGPFKVPPMAGFRANPLLAVARNNAIRPIVNLSEPKGHSFNDNVDQSKIEKVKMATAKSFSYNVRKAGVGASMSKFDLKDAYKIVPVKKEDWRLQGFKWLGRFFIETQLIFGAGPSVANFDRLAKTLVDLTCIKSSIPASLVTRTLDDIPVISPKKENWTEEFSRNFRKICSDLNVPLADNCPKHEKAFENSTFGVVLGIEFDTEKQEWSLPGKKADKLIKKIDGFLNAEKVSLKEVRSLMGSVNNFAQLCIFVNPFKFLGNQLLAMFEGDESTLLEIPRQVKQDLLVVANAAETARRGLPIAAEPSLPGLGAMHFYTDAAGGKYALCRGKRIPLDKEIEKGVAGVGISNTNTVWWWSRVSWSTALLHYCSDEKGAIYGNKMTTLEAVGLLLPLMTVPENLMGRELVFHVDNISVMYGWENGGCKHDVSATIILRAVFLISNFLGITIHVDHVPRMSDKWAELADSLTRSTTCSESVFGQMGDVKESKVEGSLLEWIKKPSEDWELPGRLLKEIESKMQSVNVVLG
jgi:hypothetical protein